MGHEKKQDQTWMKNHPLEGDDIVTGIYNNLIKRNPKNMKPCRGICVPDTVVFERNFPRGWYTTDVKAVEIMRKQGKDLDAATIEAGFLEGVKDTCPIVATYLSTNEEQTEENGTLVKTYVEVFNKNTIGEFLARKKKKDGILQKFVMPKGYYNSVIKCVWSPRVCMVRRRTNKYPILDKKRAENDPFCTTVTYEGPLFLSEESGISGNIAMEVKKLCGHMVQHFYYTEHKFITRMVVYFKNDKNDRIWFLWCGSLRVSDRNASSELPVNLITNFVEPEKQMAYPEDHLLWDADSAYLRVTGDEMFYETHMKHVKLMTIQDKKDAAGKEQASEEIKATDYSLRDIVLAPQDTYQWDATPPQVQDTFARLSAEREEILQLFEDVFYQIRGSFIVRPLEDSILEVPPRAVEVLTENGIVDIMRLLHLDQKAGDSKEMMRYVVRVNMPNPLQRQADAAAAWINDFFDRKINRLKETVKNMGSDKDAFSREVEQIYRS